MINAIYFAFFTTLLCTVVHGVLQEMKEREEEG